MAKRKKPVPDSSTYTGSQFPMTKRNRQIYGTFCFNLLMLSLLPLQLTVLWLHAWGDCDP